MGRFRIAAVCSAAVLAGCAPNEPTPVAVQVAPLTAEVAAASLGPDDAALQDCVATSAGLSVTALQQLATALPDQRSIADLRRFASAYRTCATLPVVQAAVAAATGGSDTACVETLTDSTLDALITAALLTDEARFRTALAPYLSCAVESAAAATLAGRVQLALARTTLSPFADTRTATCVADAFTDPVEAAGVDTALTGAPGGEQYISPFAEQLVSCADRDVLGRLLAVTLSVPTACAQGLAALDPDAVKDLLVAYMLQSSDLGDAAAAQLTARCS
jgi:hypothetical protein